MLLSRNASLKTQIFSTKTDLCKQQEVERCFCMNFIARWLSVIWTKIKFIAREHYCPIKFISTSNVQSIVTTYYFMKICEYPIH